MIMARILGDFRHIIINNETKSFNFDMEFGHLQLY